MANKIWLRFIVEAEFQVGDKTFFSKPGTVVAAFGKHKTSHGSTKYRICLQYPEDGPSCDFTIDELIAEEISAEEAHLCHLLES